MDYGLSIARGERTDFPTIRPISVRELVLDAIRDAILAGKLQPGDRIIESRLSKQMGVGQNAVRETLQELEFQGFVVRVPNKGAFVTDFSLEDINQIYRFRMEFEGLAAQLAREAGRPNPADVEQLVHALEEMEAGAAANDCWRFSRADLQFHEIFWHLSGNRYVEKALRAVATPQFSYVLLRSSRQTPLDLPAICRQHRDILEQLKSGQPRACREYVSKVTEDFWRQIVQVMAEQQK